MSPLGPKARSLLAEADGADLPSGDAKERVRGRLGVALGGAVVGGAVTKGGAAAAATSAKSGGLAWISKLLAGTAVLAVGAGLVVVRSETHAPDPKRTAPAAAVVPVASPIVAPPGNAKTIDERPPLDVHEGVETNTPAPAAVHAPSTAAAARGPMHGGPSTPPPPGSIVAGPRAPATLDPGVPPASANGEGEANLLAKAQAAIAAGDGILALDALDAHARQYPDGMLAASRDGERVIAMCLVGRTQATRDAALGHLAARPHSEHTARIKRACGLP